MLYQLYMLKASALAADRPRALARIQRAIDRRIQIIGGAL